jgi:TolB-like protein/Tfp pilus assembly protein PilF
VAAALIAELKRRRVFRALAAYALVAFAVLQVVEPVMHGLHLPEWTLSFVVVALGVGLPIVLVLAWIFDVGPGGIQRTDTADAPDASRAAARRIAFLLAVVGAVIAAPLIAWHFARGRTGEAAPASVATRTPASASVAVLPFVNMSRDKDDDYFSDGITEEVINALANVEGVRVVSRTSAFAYKGKDLSVRKIGEELAVSTVLEGSVRREGNEVRIAAQLINAQDGYHLWSKTYDRQMSSVFAVEDELARSIAAALRPQLLKESAPLVQQPTASAQAHDLYLRGRHFWNKRTDDDLRKALALFQQALEVDPNYALAHAGIADSYVLLSDYGSYSAAGISQARKHAYKALELDGSLAEAHATLGLIGMYDYDWATAESEFKRAIELRSGYATAHHWYALLLTTLGRFPEARVEAERALQLDPASLIVNNMVGVVAYDARQYDRAIESFRRTLQLDPNFFIAKLFLACAYVSAGKSAQGLAELEQLEQLPGLKNAKLELLALRAWMLSTAGDKAAAARLVKELDSRSRDQKMTHTALLAAMQTLVDDKDRAFALLDTAIAERDPMVRDLKVSPMWDPLRADPRFGKMLKRLNLD